MNHIEAISTRLHLDATIIDGVLTVTGTGSGDRISIGLANGETQIHVTTGPLELAVPRQTEAFDVNEVMGISVSGGNGGDYLTVGAGLPPVTMDGGGGTDVLNGSENDDFLFGGSGRDVIKGLGGSDFIRGGSGDDYLLGEGSLFEGAGTTGQSGSDTLYGDGGNDTLEGDTFGGTLMGSGKDRLHGNAGNDELAGGDQRDRLFGGDGRDTLRGGSGPDLLDGGAENDKIFSGGDSSVADTVIGGSGAHDRVVIPDEADILSGIEHVSV